MRLTGAVLIAAAASAVGLVGVSSGITAGPQDTATGASDPLRQQVDAYLTGLELDGFAGAILIVRKGDVWLRKGYGFADREQRRRVQPETIFDIGSITKPMTMAAILKLESQGRLTVAGTLAKFFPSAAPDKRGITIQQLLTHTAGFPSAIGDDYTLVRRDEIVQQAFATPLLFPPGEKSSYSNTGYSLLAAVVELTGGRPYERYVHDEVLAPAGLKKTGYTIPKWEKTELAVGYQDGQRWGTPLDHAWLPDGPGWHLRGNGGILSNVDELHRWLVALDAGAVLQGNAKSKFFEHYARATERGRRVRAIGGNDVFNAIFSWWIDYGVVTVMMTNVDRFPSEEIVPKIENMLFAERRP